MDTADDYSDTEDQEDEIESDIASSSEDLEDSGSSETEISVSGVIKSKVYVAGRDLYIYDFVLSLELQN